MFIERLLNQGNAPLLQQAVRFSAARHKLLANNIANVDTPGYLQQDLPVAKFRAMLRERVGERKFFPPGTVVFDDIAALPEELGGGVVFHDGNNRSMEQLMTESASNALYHNMMLELLRKQYSSIENALKERVG
jgi:flagellar basal-body rod protein FlgB